MKLAVLVATRDEEHCIGRRISNIEACSVPQGWSVSVQVLDNGSSDRTREIVSGHSPTVQTQVVLHDLGPIGKCAALYHGFEHVEADLFVMSDANTLFAPDTLAAFIAAQAENPEAGVFVGNIRNTRTAAQGEAFLASDAALPMRPRVEQKLGAFSGANGGCYAVRASAIAGIWMTAPVRNDDFVISVYAAARGSVIFVAGARAYETEDDQLPHAFSRKYRDALGHHRALVWIARNVPLPAALLALAVRLTLWFVIPLSAVLVLIMLPQIIALVIVAAAMLLRRTRLLIARTVALYAGYLAGAFGKPPLHWQPTR